MISDRFKMTCSKCQRGFDVTPETFIYQQPDESLLRADSADRDSGMDMPWLEDHKCPFVGCSDADCRALKRPTTLDEYIVARDHWWMVDVATVVERIETGEKE